MNSFIRTETIKLQKPKQQTEKCVIHGPLNLVFEKERKPGVKSNTDNFYDVRSTNILFLIQFKSVTIPLLLSTFIFIFFLLPFFTLWAQSSILYNICTLQKKQRPYLCIPFNVHHSLFIQGLAHLWHLVRWGPKQKSTSRKFCTFRIAIDWWISS